MNGISDDAVTIIQSIRPYKEGNLLLWQLHRLDIFDKHRLLIFVGSAYKNAMIDVAAPLKYLMPDADLPTNAYWIESC